MDEKEKKEKRESQRQRMKRDEEKNESQKRDSEREIRKEIPKSQQKAITRKRTFYYGTIFTQGRRTPPSQVKNSTIGR